METDNGHDDVKLYDSARTYRGQTKIPVGTMEIPAHLNKASTSRVNVSDRRQLESRKRNLHYLERRAEEAEEEASRAQAEYYQFVDLMKQFQEADNARNPTENQARVIREINESVQSINLTGPGDGTPEITRKMAEKVLGLKKVMDTANASSNAANKVRKLRKSFYF